MWRWSIYNTHKHLHTHTLTHMHTPKHTHTYTHTYILWVLVWGREELPTTLKLTNKVNKFIAILYEYYIYIHTYYTYIYIYKYFRLFQRILQPRNPSNNKWVDDWYKQTKQQQMFHSLTSGPIRHAQFRVHLPAGRWQKIAREDC